MSLKQKIKEKLILQSGAIDLQLELPGEPMIYSVKYQVGARKRGAAFFRNKKMMSILKCHFRSYFNTNTPVVLLVKFYLTPPEYVNLKDSTVKSECLPATRCFELCEYLLSLMDMLFHVLYNSYRQIVRIEMEKWYSKRPRTVFQFMRYDHYEQLKNDNTLHTKSKKLSAPGPVGPPLQPKSKRNGRNKKMGQKIYAGKQHSDHEGPITSSSTFSNTCTDASDIQ